MEGQGCNFRSNLPHWSHLELEALPTERHDCYLRPSLPHWSHLEAASLCTDSFACLVNNALVPLKLLQLFFILDGVLWN